MTNFNSHQERNAKALEIAGHIVSDLVGELRLGMFDTRADADTRERRRAQVGEEIADLTKKIASSIVTFI